MDWLSLPPLSSLRAFAAVAEVKSLSAAGRSLNVTHAAVSQQVKSLEDYLGVRLVIREGRGVALTPEGELLAAGLMEAFSTVRESVDRLTQSEKTRPLHVTMTPSFAVSWLMPRISDFRMDHPDIELMLNPTSDVVELEPGGVDLAIRFGDGSWPGLESELLLPTNYVVVGATCLIGDKKVSDPEDLLQFPWLQELGTNELALWLEKQGVIPKGKLNITHLPGYMVLEGLRRGEGITASAGAFVEADVAAGTLQVLFEDLRSGSSGYYLVKRPGVMRPQLKAFVSWIRKHC